MHCCAKAGYISYPFWGDEDGYIIIIFNLKKKNNFFSEVACNYGICITGSLLSRKKSYISKSEIFKQCWKALHSMAFTGSDAYFLLEF